MENYFSAILFQLKIKLAYAAKAVHIWVCSFSINEILLFSLSWVFFVMEAFDHCENKCAFFKHFYRLKTWKRKGTSAYAIMQLLKLGGRFLIRQIFARETKHFFSLAINWFTLHNTIYNVRIKCESHILQSELIQ